MAIPGYQDLMLPFLQLASNGVEQKFRDAIERLATDYKLTNEERAAMLPSGTAPVFDNRVGWARTYLKQAGLVESPRRGTFKITEDGRALLKENPKKIDVSLLHRYPKFREFLSRRREDKESQETPVREATREAAAALSATPEDSLADAYSRIREGLEVDLLEQVKKSPPSFFERLVVDLLVKMGYGGNRVDAGRAIGRSGDDGIDGIINEDKLGLDVIYIQAKRWEATVGRPEIQKFAGALQGQRARKGIFITTSDFSREAEEYAARIDTRIILINGEKLTALMFDYNIGVTATGVYELKKLDSDYFEGE